MKDFPSCFGENAVQVSDFSSSSSSSGAGGGSSNKTGHNLVTNVYQCELGRHHHSCFITIGWSKNLIGQGFSVGIDDTKTDQCLCKIDINPWLFSKRKGSKTLEAYSTKIDIYWDLSSAKFIGSSPEPFEGFYVAIATDQQMILLLGDMPPKEAFKKTSPTTTNYAYPPPTTLPFAKREHIYGKKNFSTKVRFCSSINGYLHDLAVECDTSGFVSDPCLVIRVDSKIVMQVKRLQWKFRGNHTILVDGLEVEVLWDVHNWLSGSSSNGNAVFMFKTIVSAEKQQWTSRELVLSDQDSSWSQRILDTRSQQNQGFSLILYAWKML
ncbi:uncharacterized protein LOC124914608 [Impatiens glandulifera]|uniref:uncharacterized protein LOC124914608 n=1 Tax=Impatiens glandulifera TaxID=253017 RepID=UPI001FB19875|nr:uncharacterized protein LOC124914608 [Impatiens glandulifera]